MRVCKQEMFFHKKVVVNYLINVHLEYFNVWQIIFQIINIYKVESYFAI